MLSSAPFCSDESKRRIKHKNQQFLLDLLCFSLTFFFLCRAVHIGAPKSAMFENWGEILSHGFPSLLKSGLSDYWFTFDEFEGYKHPIPLCIAVGSSLLYLFLVYVVAPATVPKDPARVQAITNVHNIILFLFSLACCSAVAYWMTVNNEWPWSAGNLDGSLRPMVCNPIPLWFWYLQITFTFSKIYEWFDTILLVWKNPAKPKLMFLHVYHHATTFWLFLHVSSFFSVTKMGILLNGFVHTLMYLHYYRPFPKPLVPMITLAQIAQLVFVTYIWSITPGTCGGKLGRFPTDHPFDMIVPYLMAPVYALFFIKLFFERFVLGKNVKGKGGDAKLEVKKE